VGFVSTWLRRSPTNSSPLRGRSKVGVKEEEGLSTIYHSPRATGNIGVETEKSRSCKACRHLCGVNCISVT
jgi:hypothetical protein